VQVGDLIRWSEIHRQIVEARDFDTIGAMRGKLEVLDVVARQRHESLQVRNRIDRYHIELAWRAAELYKQLPESRGRRRAGDGGSTSKQDALDGLGVAKTTMSRWVETLDIPFKRRKLDTYEARCDDEDRPLTFQGFRKFALDGDERLRGVKRRVTIIMRGGEPVEVRNCPSSIEIEVYDEDFDERRLLT